MKWRIISAAALTVIGWISLLGLPGLTPLFLGGSLYYLFIGAGNFGEITNNLGDRAWPLTLFLSAAWPRFLPTCWKLSDQGSSPATPSGESHSGGQQVFVFLISLLFSLSIIGFISLWMATWK